MANNAPPRPDKQIHLEESDMTFTMTYVVMNDILRFVGTIDQAMASIMTDQDTRNLIIRRLMTDNKKPIQKDEDLIPMEDVDVDIYDLDDLFAWVLDHVTYFFMRMASKVSESTEKYPELRKMMMSSDLSETGSNPSQTQTKSVGPTA